MPNNIFAEILTGSRLYGTASVFSDTDIYRIVYPTVEQLVSNRNVTIAQYTDDLRDIKTVLLGEFVMTLGHDVERSLSALHYPEYFGELKGYWWNWEFADRLLTVAKGMFEHARTDKDRAHAYRLWMAYIFILNREKETVYPMSDHEREIYLAIKDGAPVRVDWNPTINLRGVPQGKINKTALADWVWDKYQQEGL